MKKEPIRNDVSHPSLSHPSVAAITVRKRSSRRPRAPRSWPATRAANQALLLAALSMQQVCLATLHYEGNGDEGAPAEVKLFTDEHGEITVAEPTAAADSPISIWVARPGPHQPEHKATRFVREAMTLEEALELFGWEAVEHLHGGFWNGAGGEGDVRFHPATGTVMVCHDDYITDTIHTETRL